MKAADVGAMSAVLEGDRAAAHDDIVSREAELRAAQATAGGGNQVGQAEAQVQTATSQTEVNRANVAAAQATLIDVLTDG